MCRRCAHTRAVTKYRSAVRDGKPGNKRGAWRGTTSTTAAGRRQTEVGEEGKRGGGATEMCGAQERPDASHPPGQGKRANEERKINSGWVSGGCWRREEGGNDLHARTLCGTVLPHCPSPLARCHALQSTSLMSDPRPPPAPLPLALSEEMEKIANARSRRPLPGANLCDAQRLTASIWAVAFRGPGHWWRCGRHGGDGGQHRRLLMLQ